MKVMEYGKENGKIIVLLHGGGLSWWNYKSVAEILQDDYHIVIPILDGHADSDRAFSSIEDNAREVIEYIDEKYSGSVWAIGGLSLGGQILVEILSRRSDICKIAFVESALVLPMKWTYYFVEPMMDMSFGLIKQQWFAKLQFKSLKINQALYDAYYRDTCKITKEDMIAFLKANASYQVKETISNTKASVYLFVGEKEAGKMIRSAHKLHTMIPDSVLEIKKNKFHGEFSINDAKEYAEKMRAAIASEEQ